MVAGKGRQNFSGKEQEDCRQRRRSSAREKEDSVPPSVVCCSCLLNCCLPPVCCRWDCLPRPRRAATMVAYKWRIKAVQRLNSTTKASAKVARKWRIGAIRWLNSPLPWPDLMGLLLLRWSKEKLTAKGGASTAETTRKGKLAAVWWFHSLQPVLWWS